MNRFRHKSRIHHLIQLFSHRCRGEGIVSEKGRATELLNTTLSSHTSGIEIITVLVSPAVGK